jgi:hypothetical protein
MYIPAMPLSDSGRKDPSMMGTSAYERVPLDFYPTPDSAIDSLFEVIADDLPSYQVWEPFCGDGAISKRMGDARNLVSTDIKAYPGFDPDGLFDFFQFVTQAEATERYNAWRAAHPDPDNATWNDATTLDWVTALKGFTPDAIITNPPYGKDAEKAARHALKLMEEQKGLVAFLCRHEWDCAKSRSDLFDHPAFTMKITLRHRPRWIAGSDGAPRFPYSWFIWNFTKAYLAPHARPELVYAK